MLLNTLAKLIGDRIVAGFSTMPVITDWLWGFLLISIYALIVIPFGLGQGFLRWDLQLSSSTIFRVTISSLVTPAILEEFLFRVVLLPHPSEAVEVKYVLLWSVVSLFLFVIYHPLNALTFFPSGREAFFEPIFLCFAGLLGLICTLAYLYSASVWIPVIIHWLTVIIWLLCFGGINKLGFLDR